MENIHYIIDVIDTTVFPYVITFIKFLILIIEHWNSITLNYKTSTIIIFYILSAIVLTIIYRIIKKILNIFCYILSKIFSFILTIFSKEKLYLSIVEKIQKISLLSRFNKKYKKVFDFTDKGKSTDEIYSEISRLRNNDKLFISAKRNNSDEHLTDEIKHISGRISKKYSYSNFLHPDVFFSARYIESELIKFFINQSGGNELINCGVTTVSNLESLILPFLAYKSMKKCNSPKIIISEDCPSIYYHLAFLLDVKLIHVQLNERRSVDTIFFRKKLIENKNSIIGAVGFYYNPSSGVEDDIEELGKICNEFNIPLHVDANYGGIFSLFSREKMTKLNFKIDGITSISYDLSTTFSSPTNLGIILYKNREIRKHQYFCYAMWIGGVYCSPTLLGSRMTNNIYASYSNLAILGKNYYKTNVKRKLEISRALYSKLKNDQNITVFDEPNFNLVTFSCNNAITVYWILSRELNWDISFKLSKVTKNQKNDMDCISIHVTDCNMNVVEKSFYDDLKLTMNRTDLSLIAQSKEILALKEVNSLPVKYQNLALRIQSDKLIC